MEATSGSAVPDRQTTEDLTTSVLPAAASAAVAAVPPSAGGPAEASTSGPLQGGAEAATEVDTAGNESLERSELTPEGAETEAAATTAAGGGGDTYCEAAGGQAAKGEETNGEGNVADE